MQTTKRLSNTFFWVDIIYMNNHLDTSSYLDKHLELISQDTNLNSTLRGNKKLEERLCTSIK